MPLLTRFRLADRFHKLRQTADDTSRERTGSTSLRSAGAFHPNDTYAGVRTLQSGDHRACFVLRSQTSGRLLVVKHARARKSSSTYAQSTGRRKPLPTEARILLSKLLPHANIVRLYAAELDSVKMARHLLYMEYCAGGDLLAQLQKFEELGMPAPTIFTLHVLVGLCDALAYVHHDMRHARGTQYIQEKNHQPIIHGDIKPENVFLRWPGKQECGMPDIVLGDFGMAQLEDESWGITGTPGYDSPEVAAICQLQHDDPSAYKRARNARIMTTKSDIFQLGLVVYLMAVNAHFRAGDDPSSIELPPQYANMTGFLAAVVWLLQDDPRDRPECSGALEDGMLYAVDVMRRHRDGVFQKDGALDKQLWNLDQFE